MYILIWEHQVKPDQRAEFEKVYAADGAWAELFKKGTGYVGTELLRQTDQPLRFLTIDRWASKEEYEIFQSQWEKEYKALDAQCETLTDNESQLGRWDSA